MPKQVDDPDYHHENHTMSPTPFLVGDSHSLQDAW